MQTNFGDPSAAPERFGEAVRLVFRTEHFQLKWSHCSATADYLSEFYAHLLAPGRTATQVKEVSHSIAYLVNELVENAVKFRASGDVEVEAGVTETHFLLRIRNAISGETNARFQSLLGVITAGDPGDLLIERIEANAEGHGDGSGLGLLTLMSDYNAGLSWSFQPAEGDDGRVLLETIARLTIPEATAVPTPTKPFHGN